MTDRELLEFSAKAAGMEYVGCGRAFDTAKQTQVAWNPLADDTDAFRLMVKLGMSVWQSDVANADFDGSYDIRVDYNGDLYAATRRAITAAAAEIGRV